MFCYVGVLFNSSHKVKSQKLLVPHAGEHSHVPVWDSTIKEERKTDGLSSETHPARSQTLESVCFSLIQSTHNKGMHITTASVSLFLLYSNTRVSFYNTCLKKSSLCVRARFGFKRSIKLSCAHTYIHFIHNQSQTSYKHAHIYLLHIPTWAPPPKKNKYPPPHTQHKTQPHSQVGIMMRHGDSARPEK